jgi:hypothetical protein
MTSPPIADRPELLTPEWLTAALRTSDRFAAVVVHGVDPQPVGTGQMCDSLRLHLSADGPDDAPRTVIAKLPAADETSRATARTLRSYENEVRFYQQLAPTLPVRTPTAYYADIDPATARFVLLLEDLSPAEPGDQLAGCTAGQAAAALDELVRLHAPRWGDPSLAELEWLHRDPAGQREFMLGLLPALWEGFTERYADRLGADVLSAGAGVFGHLGSYLRVDLEPKTIVHGDYRLDNLLFGGGSGAPSVAVVDWQTCTHGSGLADVAYFIGAGLDPALRRSVERGLVESYHDGLVASGVRHYGMERCWWEYRRGSWAGLLMAVGASMLVEQTERGDEMFVTMATRHATHALDLDAIGTLTG